MTRLSIIIPVHNAKDDLKRCLQSIINQVEDNDEIILVEDSSTDGSYELCDNYADEYSFIHTYHVNFRGPSPTRSYGIKQSKGEYIFFIDSDDWIEDQTVSKMMEKASSYDMVVGGYFFETPDQTVLKKLNSKTIDKKDIFELYNAELLNVLWNKIFNASIIREHNILFDDQLKKGEDLLFILQYLQYINTDISILDECFYHYISKDTGINKSHKETMDDKRNRMVMIMKEFLNIVEDHNLFTHHMINMYFRHIRDYLSVEQNKSKLSKLLFIKNQARSILVKDILNNGNGIKISILKLLHGLHLDIIMFVFNRLLLK